MTCEGIEGVVFKNRNEPTWTGDAMKFFDELGSLVLQNVMEDTDREHDVETVVGKGERLSVVTLVVRSRYVAVSECDHLLRHVHSLQYPALIY
jgi:hypothetical protein